MAKKREYSDIFNLNSVSLCKKDLFELEKILVESSETDEIDIRLTFDSTTISAESIEELLDNTDLPVYTDELSMDMKRWIKTKEYTDITCGVSLSLYHNHINCHIHSQDQTWFLGKKSQVKIFFNSKIPWYSFLNKSSVIFPAIVMLLIFYSSSLLAKGEYYEMILPILCSVILIIVNVLTSQRKLFPFVRIYLQDNSSIKFGFNELCALIGAISGFATLIQLLSKLFK